MSDVKTDQEVEVTQEVATVSVTDVEAAATQQGWKPDGELGALEFLSNGSKFRDGLHKKIADIEESNTNLYNMLAKDIHKRESAEHQQVQKSVEEQIREAANVGDADLVLELTKKLNRPAPVEPEDPKNNYVDQWAKENKWFDSEADMADDARGFYMAEQHKNGGVDDPEKILPKVKARIEKLYPTYFNPTNPNRDTGGAEKDGGKPLKTSNLNRSDLTQIEQGMFDQFVKGGADPKKLLASYARQRVS